MSTPAPSWLPTDAWVRALAAPALMFIAVAADRNYQTDLWHHLARGRVIVEEGQLLNEDRFTYTVPGQSFQDVNWLSQVIFYHLHQLGGLELLQTVNALLMALVMAVLVALCWRGSGSWVVPAGVGLFTFLGLWQVLLIRPQTFSFLLFVLLYAVLELGEQRRWLLLFAPCFLALWVNLHGAFPIGLVLIGCYLFAALVERGWREGWGVLRDGWVRVLALTLLVALLATLINPYGWRVYEYVGLTSGTATERKIDEWLPPGLNLLIGKVWVLSILGALLLFALPGRRPTVREVCLILCFLPPSCGSVRMVPWWLLILAPIAASLLVANLRTLRVGGCSSAGINPAAPEPPGLSRRSDPAGINPAAQEDTSRRSDEPTLTAAIVCGLLLLAIIISLPWLENYNPLLRWVRGTHRIEYDLQAVADHLREEHPPGNVFTRLEWSEYLTWELAGRYPVFMDGRIEIFPDEVWAEYSAVTSGRADWEEILRRHQVKYLIVDEGPYHGHLRPLVVPARWRRTFASGNVVLYQRVQ